MYFGLHLQINVLMRSFFSPAPLFLDTVLGVLRVILGFLLTYHGWEVFDPEVMKSYTEWDQFKGPMAYFLVYAGKSAELVSGILFMLGLFTRIGALICIITLAYITWLVGHGKFWYEDQHPFMFVLFGILYLFAGPGKWSLDGLWFGKK